MTLIQVFDRLLKAPVNRIEFADDSFVRCPRPMSVALVEFDADVEIWIEASEDGLALHFNANRISPQGESGLTAQVEPLANIVNVS